MFQSNVDFINAFDLQSDQNYFDQVALTDTKFGFSVKRRYPSNVLYKPVLKRNGEPNDVAVGWVVLREEIVDPDGKMPITVRVSNFSLTSGMFRDFDANDQNAPTLESLEISKKSPQPAELQYTKDYFYDSRLNKFIDKKGRSLSGVQILDKAFEEHFDTVRSPQNWELHLKVLTKKIIDKFFIYLIWSQKLLLEKAFRYQVGYKNPLYSMPLSLTLFEYTDIKRTDGETIEFAGLKAHKSTVVIFCICVVLSYAGSFKEWWNLSYFEKMPDDSFLKTAHVICGLAFIEIFPKIALIPLLNKTIKARAAVNFMAFDPFTYKRWLPQFSIVLLIGFICFVIGYLTPEENLYLLINYINKMLGMINRK